MNAALRVPPLFKCIRGLGPTVCGVGGLPLCGGGEKDFFSKFFQSKSGDIAGWNFLSPLNHFWALLAGE